MMTAVRSKYNGLIAPCGMNCGLCIGYLREKKPCGGCFKKDDENKPKQCRSCVIVNCELLANTQMALGYFNSNLRGGCFRDGHHNAAPTNTYLVDAEQTSKEASKCAFALDLEAYDAAYAGKNLASQGLPLVLHSQIDSAGGITGTGAVLVDLYVIHDVMYVLDGMNGVITANS